MTLIDDHVLLPHPPDWQAGVAIRQRWQTLVSGAVTGHEDRASAKPKALAKLRWTVLPLDHRPRVGLVAALLAASKSGLAVAPFWGRGARLATEASGDSVTLSASPDTFRAEDRVFFSNLEPENPDAWEVRTVQSFSDNVLSLDQALARSYSFFVWPLLFGRFRCLTGRWLNLTHVQIRLEIEQLELRSDEVADTLPGWDFLFETFEGYPLTDDNVAEGSLNRGSGWNGPASVRQTEGRQYVAFDDLASYAEGDPLDGASGGEGWAGAWQLG